jgi:signal peptidase I
MSETPSGPIVKKRRPWLAALLSLLAPGLGQLYNGQWAKAILYPLVYNGVILAMGSFLPVTYAGLFFWAYIVGMLYLAQVVDACLSARNRSTYPLRRYNRIIVYIAFFVLAWGLYSAARHFMRTFGYEMYKIPTGSMESTLEPGDYLTARKGRLGPIGRSELIILRSPYDGKILVGRCVAIGMDTVEMRHKQLWINGKTMVEPFAKNIDKSEIPAPPEVLWGASPQGSWTHGKFTKDYWARDNFGPVVVPVGHLFMLGDNRDNSFDSRFWGPLDQAAVIGKPLYVYFSKDPKRIGTTLR